MHNPFALFELPVTFSIDLTQLKLRYLALQKQLHPDNFAHKSEQEQRMAMQKSTQINDAWQQLSHPVLRAESIIQLHLGENQQMKSNHDVAFLMQQMQWREELEGIEEQQDLSALDAFSAKIQLQNQSIMQNLAEKLEKQDWEQAKKFTDQLRFIQKLEQEIERVDEKLTEF